MKKHLPNESEDNDFNSACKNIEKYIRISIILNKNKTQEETKYSIKFDLKFIDSSRLMATCL